MCTLNAFLKNYLASVKSVRFLGLVKPELSLANCCSEGNKPLEPVLPSSFLLSIS